MFVSSEFDIEQGSKISAIYPENCLAKLTETKEDELSDYMVPEGAHNSEHDWTIFILNRTKTIKKVPKEEYIYKGVTKLICK